ncbi:MULTISPECIES: hypothetical protein [unclassified Chelatococcus]|uniref:hypothetical protein n=1 Tax=unclassified Chelatococcus TaxID=2638111 RepID=UPI001BCD7F44|nr:MULTISPECIES: hypothetical protein [unclassified Chelatococcus]CAH1672522.1 conserved membrane hypothetical protein [Hyphomicrobiales bacterium]MBS7738940.1 hypothetical protein [Chelatococcus sp. HY11]MBX3543373.1 hypothetical protein [Chelatococcus sp.]MCO5076531.1 hypothetical protein [Chelatococcus sp.]CAH1675240.1 conserved membrane hypothetical protein [Hyphomicrobiales bacterium]
MPSVPKNSYFVMVVERFSPLFIAVACIVIAIAEREWVTQQINGGRISLDGLFSAVFGWSAIQTGFVFSVFGFVATKTTGFIGEISRTHAMRIFHRYTWRAMVVGFLLTLYSIPLMIWKFDVNQTVQYYIVVFWFALFGWAFASFLRVALNFGKMVSVRDVERIPG